MTLSKHASAFPAEFIQASLLVLLSFALCLLPSLAAHRPVPVQLGCTTLHPVLRSMHSSALPLFCFSGPGPSHAPAGQHGWALFEGGSS